MGVGMEDETFVREKDIDNDSWHLLATWTRVPGRALSICGRTLNDAESRGGLPPGKTCETCFRIKATESD